jgi:hypothetical protein
MSELRVLHTVGTGAEKREFSHWMSSLPSCRNVNKIFDCPTMYMWIINTNEETCFFTVSPYSDNTAKRFRLSSDDLNSPAA